MFQLKRNSNYIMKDFNVVITLNLKTVINTEGHLNVVIITLNETVYSDINILKCRLDNS